MPQEQRRPSRPASRATDRKRLLGVLELPQVRLHDEQRAIGRSARCRPGTAGAQGRCSDLPQVRVDQRDPSRRRCAGRGLCRRPARSGGTRATGAPHERPAGRREPRSASRRRPPVQWHQAIDRAGRGGVTGRSAPRDGRASVTSDHPTDPLPLERFLRALAARDASPHTLRAYRTAIGAYLEWLAEQGIDWRRPARHQLRGYLARLGSGASRSTVAQRLAAIRSFHRWAAREGLTTGDPWGAIATPRLPRRLPRVLEVDEVGRLLAVIDDELAAA